MIRRHPLLVGVAGLALIAFAYFSAAPPMHRWFAEQYYQRVERRLVSDRRNLIPARQTRLFGMYRPELPNDFVRFREVGQLLAVRPTIVSYYQAWGDGPGHHFDATSAERTLRQGLTPMITWEPWLNAFKSRGGSAAPFGLSDILQGRFDSYITDFARATVRAKGPLFLRPFHEIGNPLYPWSTSAGNSPDKVAAAWRHVVSIFRREGAINVAFVWTPFRPEDIAAWPGDEWVDWIGLDLFNYGGLLNGGIWQGFESLLSDHLKPFNDLRHPVMLAEVGCSGVGGDCVGWWPAAMGTLTQPVYSNVAALVVFDHPYYVHDGKTVVDWGFSTRPNALTASKPLTAAAGFLAPSGR